jgi:hypothetical protein
MRCSIGANVSCTGGPSIQVRRFPSLGNYRWRITTQVNRGDNSWRIDYFRAAFGSRWTRNVQQRESSDKCLVDDTVCDYSKVSRKSSVAADLVFMEHAPLAV